MLQHVRSVAELEILLLVSASPERSWSPSAVYRTVLSNEALVESTLEKFSRLGLLQKNESSEYRFSPASEDIKDAVKALAALHHERPNRIIQAIYEVAPSEIEEFAKAYVASHKK